MCRVQGLCHDRASPPNYLFMRAGPGVATDAKSNEITAICLTDTLIKCGGHDESVDVVGIHLIRFGRVQNQYRPPGLCVVFRDGQRHAPITRGLKQLGFDDYFTPPQKCPPRNAPPRNAPPRNAPPRNAPPEMPPPTSPPPEAPVRRYSQTKAILLHRGSCFLIRLGVSRIGTPPGGVPFGGRAVHQNPRAHGRRDHRGERFPAPRPRPAKRGREQEREALAFGPRRLGRLLVACNDGPSPGVKRWFRNAVFGTEVAHRAARLLPAAQHPPPKSLLAQVPIASP